MLPCPEPKASWRRGTAIAASLLLGLAGCSRRPALPYDMARLSADDRCDPERAAACLTPPPPMLAYDPGAVRIAVIPPTVAARARASLRLVVSLPQQRLFAYRDGVMTESAPVSTGKPGHATPSGLYHISQKLVFHRSNRYSNAPMPYMQRLTASGIALHAGHLPGYPASHGCIRLPLASARRLYRMTSLGTPVLVTRSAVTRSGSARRRGRAFARTP